MKLSDLFGGDSGIPADQFPDPTIDAPADLTGAPQSVVLGGGCFWCTEAVFAKLDGVNSVVSGYAGGTPETADYQSVCSGMTDHAEVIRVRYDSRRISLGQILKVFFAVAHDPTQLNRQGNDMGRQYRSSIFYASVNQEGVAAAYIQQLNDAKVLDQPIVTTLEPLEQFFEAEAYHQEFVARNPNQPYVAAVAMPKVKKLEKSFADKLKRS
ncbi:MAG: peptide-methionine (S)-S-oxide reductase [Acidobacterium sp.]|nr:peptide-methionine (S)-S-oxide reductase [Acidobacteriota bacterium]PHY09234.1 MAG: peptide-methionine (S)-S-oxide reductase [Acidobacterium sp.]